MKRNSNFIVGLTSWTKNLSNWLVGTKNKRY